MNISDVIFDSNGRLRSGWRFVVFCVGFISLATLLGTAMTILPDSTPDSVFRLASVLIVLVSSLLVGWLCGKYLERLPFKALGASPTKGWFIHLLAGLVIGAATLGLAVGIAVVLGGLRFEVYAVDASILVPSLLTSFLFLALAAASEEALFRGYPFQTFARSGLAWFAIALTSIFFAFVHLRNPNSSWIAAINTALAGVWFGVAYLKTRDLWFVWGLHLMWNWAQGALFGIEISGLTELTPASLLREIDSGPAWLTGETYGVEGGIVTTVALVVSTVAIYLIPSGGTSDEPEMRKPAR